MKQLTFDDILPVTEGLWCPRCKANTMTMKSISNSKGWLYHHPTQCTVCKFYVAPTGVKSFILEHWREGFEQMEQYAKLRGFKYEFMKDATNEQ